MTDENAKLKETLAPLAARGTPLRARLAGLAWGNMVVDKTLEVAPSLTEERLEAALDSEALGRLRAEIETGKHPLLNANPGFAAGVLFGVAIASSMLGDDDAAYDDEMAEVLCAALSSQAHLDKYNADMAEYGLAT